MPDQAYDHYNNTDKKHKKRDTVHAVHQLHINAPRIAGIALADIKVCEHLLPYSLLHNHE